VHQSKALDTANAARIADSQLKKISDKPLNFALYDLLLWEISNFSNKLNYYENK
jgi:hypothetical protein